MTAQQVADEACDRALAKLAAKSSEGERAFVTVGEVAWCTLEVLAQHGFIELEMQDGSQYVAPA